MYAADDCDDCRRGRLPVILVVGDEQTDLLRVGLRIEQQRYPLAGRELSLLVELLGLLLAAPEPELLLKLHVLGRECLETR